MDRGLYAPLVFEQLMRLDTWTPDGRYIDSGGFGTRNMPRPIYLMDTQAEYGHLGAKIAGRLDEVSVDSDGVVSGRGWALDTEHGRNAALYLDTKAIHGNSVDLADVRGEPVLYTDETGEERLGVKFTRANIGATTILGVPAFPDATADLDELVRADHSERVVASFSNTTISLASPSAPSLLSTDVDLEWFVGSEPRKPYPLTVEGDGRVHGYLATWDSTHLTNAGRMRPPRGQNYPYFNASTVLTNGGPVTTGPLVIGGDHADVSMSWTQARDYYASTSFAWADVHATDDRHGIRLNGMVRPGTPPEAVHAGRASRLSGDWRRVKGHLHLMAALSVSAPAFPVGRHFSDGTGEALILFGMDTVERVDESKLVAARGRLALSRARLLAAEEAANKVD